MDVPDDIREKAANCIPVGLEGNHYLSTLRHYIATALMAERERCAAFAYAKHDWPARWIAASLRGENSAYTDFQEHPAAARTLCTDTTLTQRVAPDGNRERNKGIEGHPDEQDG